MALALGFAHPDHMLAQLTSAQIAEWSAYYSIEPFGTRVDWMRSGLIGSILVNINRKKGAQPVRPIDLVPRIPEAEETVKKQTPEQHKSAVMRIIDWAKSTGRLTQGKRNG